MIQAQPAALAVGAKGLFDREAGLLSQVDQLILAEMMHVAQPMPAAPPIEQVISAIYVLRLQPDGVPYDKALHHPFGGHEIPHRDSDASALGKKIPHLSDQPQAQRIAGDVMQHRKGEDALEAARKA
jgi:hypothetical protein